MVESKLRKTVGTKVGVELRLDGLEIELSKERNLRSGE